MCVLLCHVDITPFAETLVLQSSCRYFWCLDFLDWWSFKYRPPLDCFCTLLFFLNLRKLPLTCFQGLFHGGFGILKILSQKERVCFNVLFLLLFHVAWITQRKLQNNPGYRHSALSCLWNWTMPLTLLAGMCSSPWPFSGQVVLECAWMDVAITVIWDDACFKLQGSHYTHIYDNQVIKHDNTMFYL